MKIERDEERNTVEDDIPECMLKMQMQMDLNPMHQVPHRVPRRGSSAVGGPNDEEVVVVLADGESNKAIV